MSLSIDCSKQANAVPIKCVIRDPVFLSQRFALPLSLWPLRRAPTNRYRHIASYDMSPPPPASLLSFVAAGGYLASRSIFLDSRTDAEI